MTAAVLVTVAVAVVTTGLLVVALPRLGLLDIPNHRSSHTRPVPRGGGAAILLAVPVGLLVAGAWSEVWATGVGASLVLGAVGFVDDVRSVSAVRRLVLQLATACVAVVLLALVADRSLPVSLLIVVGGTIWLTGFVNAFNFMDGANGLAGLTTAVAGLWYFHVGHDVSSTALEAGGLVLAAAAVGFLPWNFPRARIFLGDVGSYGTGVLVGWLALLALLETDSLLLALAPLLVVLADTSATLARRVRRGEPAMTAHRDHTYQRLGARPASPVPGVVVGTAGVLCCLAALLPSVACLVAWAGVLAAYLSLPALAGRLVGRTRSAA